MNFRVAALFLFSAGVLFVTSAALKVFVTDYFCYICLFRNITCKCLFCIDLLSVCVYTEPKYLGSKDKFVFPTETAMQDYIARPASPTATSVPAVLEFNLSILLPRFN